jgi:predicted Zn-dependent peptidase
MINFERFTLENGLRVLVHTDNSTPMVVMNILYDVGARDENPDKTGFAHLFEHLMFGGSANIPDYDEPLQLVGGENNAFTSNDITNYYLTLPTANLETGFWLESDRMLELAFSKKSLDVQRNVVIEEFKQRYLNQPYGDVWLLLRPLAYQVHPYNWATIGKEIKHVEDATMDDVKGFFYKHYRPNNAILVVAGNVTVEQVKELCNKWFLPIPAGDVPVRNLPKEPAQTEARKLTVERAVPASAIYKTWHIQDRLHPDYYAIDLASDILSNGKSSRLYQRLVKEEKLFSDINAYQTGDIDAGLFVVSGRLNNDVKMEDAEKAIDEQLDILKNEMVEERELDKLKNKLESNNVFGEMSVLNKAMNLAYAELLGDANRVNTEMESYQKVTPADIKRVANTVFTPENSSTLYYHAKN